MPINHCQICGKEFASTKRRGTCPGECASLKRQANSRIAYQTATFQRKRAHGLVKQALKLRRLTPQPCEQCCADRAVAHHDDYSKPLDVRWLCRTCHKHHHNQFGPGKNSFFTVEDT